MKKEAVLQPIEPIRHALRLFVNAGAGVEGFGFEDEACRCWFVTRWPKFSRTRSMSVGQTSIASKSS